MRQVIIDNGRDRVILGERGESVLIAALQAYDAEREEANHLLKHLGAAIVEDGYYRPSAEEYKIRKVYFEDHLWQEDTIILSDTRYINAAMKASEIAKELDAKFGDSHFWTVTLKNMKDQDYFQLFHGRLE